MSRAEMTRIRLPRTVDVSASLASCAVCPAHRPGSLHRLLPPADQPPQVSPLARRALQLLAVEPERQRGVYNLLHVRVAGAILDVKLERWQRSGARIVTAAITGCLLHIAVRAAARGVNVAAVHPIEILKAASRCP
jgi:hypothetical protein